ncbi:thioredoxin [Aliiglaciecola sp. CAU 1673]|uniref:thioredoxin n=1 Tax=Aliiglaciecola sp. CAU 1673 TaxID=3032595 RepID=UPI0023DC7C48|nr:thioredoxin [Aliiglaciecola sp. CAU 1673]MDF2177787.1 thioredoxin [Aliiglaciecola sp. CAU 1673]
MESTVNNIVNMNLDNFQQLVLETSKEKLLVVDFWADWCEPCKTLMPILEKLAKENEQHLVLVKVDCDAEQQIAMQFGVRSLPTVILVKDGQPVDGFAGVKQESEIRAMLEQHLPSPADELLSEAQQLLAAGEAEQAFTLAKHAHDLDKERADIKFVMIEAYLDLGQFEPAKTLLSTIGMVDQDATYQSLKGRIELAEQAADTPEIQALQQALQAQPDSLDVKVQLAVQLQQAGRAEEALALLLEVLQKDLNFGEAKKFMLDTINALPKGDPLASQYRRKVYSLLY